MPIKKLQLDNLHPASPLNDVVVGVNDNLDAIVQALNSVNSIGGGVVGPTGAKGDQGPQGPAGIQGPQGEQGERGLQGEQGPAGQDGKDGKDGTNGADGLPGINGKDGKDGLPGAPGPKGDTGAQGIQGPKGETGVQGIPGTAGKDGAQGPAGTQGIAGPVGPQGPIGPQGPGPVAYKGVRVDDGVEVTMDTIVVKLNTGSPRSLQFKVTTGTMNVNISGIIYWTTNGTGNVGSNYFQGKTLTTAWQQPFGWDFPWANDYAQYMLQDLTNGRFYRITLSIGPGYKGNFIVMERLV